MWVATQLASKYLHENFRILYNEFFFVNAVYTQLEFLETLIKNLQIFLLDLERWFIFYVSLCAVYQKLIWFNFTVFLNELQAKESCYIYWQVFHFQYRVAFQHHNYQ